MRVVTWNIHGSVGPDMRCRPERVLDLIATLAPDVLALQEVDGRTWLGRRRRAFETMTEALGGHVVEARMVPRPDRDHGHLLWSRWPLVDAKVHRLPGGLLEARGAIEATCTTPAGPVRLVSTHLGAFPWQRPAQAAFLAHLVARLRMPMVLLGDLNEWIADGPVHRSLTKDLPVAAAPPSWPARRPVARMDRIHVSSDLAIEDVVAHQACSSASDHLAVSATVRLRA